MGRLRPARAPAGRRRPAGGGRRAGTLRFYRRRPKAFGGGGGRRDPDRNYRRERDRNYRRPHVTTGGSVTVTIGGSVTVTARGPGTECSAGTTSAPDCASTPGAELFRPENSVRPYHTIPYHGGEEGSLQEMYQIPKKLLTIPAKIPSLRESVNPCLR